MTNSKTVEILAIETKVSAKDQRNFKVVRGMFQDFEKMMTPRGMKMITGAKKAVTFVVWEKDHASIGGKENINYDKYTAGEFIYGAPVTRAVEEYPIVNKTTGETRMATTSTVFVEENSADAQAWEIAIVKAFKSAGRVLTIEIAEVAEEATSDNPY